MTRQKKWNFGEKKNWRKKISKFFFRFFFYIRKPNPICPAYLASLSWLGVFARPQRGLPCEASLVRLEFFTPFILFIPSPGHWFYRPISISTCRSLRFSMKSGLFYQQKHISLCSVLLWLRLEFFDSEKSAEKMRSPFTCGIHQNMFTIQLKTLIKVKLEPII